MDPREKQQEETRIAKEQALRSRPVNIPFSPYPTKSRVPTDCPFEAAPFHGHTPESNNPPPSLHSQFFNPHLEEAKFNPEHLLPEDLHDFQDLSGSFEKDRSFNSFNCN